MIIDVEESIAQDFGPGYWLNNACLGPLTLQYDINNDPGVLY
jgi:hypothetical protein